MKKAFGDTVRPTQAETETSTTPLAKSRSGKVKDVYQVSEKELEFIFSDRISVFDKIIPSEIPHKGETLARTSAYWFGIADELGVLTHYIGMPAPNKMRVKRVDVISDYSKINNQTRNYLIPLEFITRYYNYGSLDDRVRDGTIKPQQLGFEAGHRVRLGEQLPEPFFEVTTKLEKKDTPLSLDEALKISGVTLQEYGEIRELSLRIDERIEKEVRKRGLMHVDGKKEFAFDRERNLMAVDTFGTGDEDRWWVRKDFEEGRYVERSKEFVRQYYRGTGYHALLMQSRKENDLLMQAGKEQKEEPPIPPLPKNMIKQASEIYIKLFEDITGQKFR